MRPSPILIIFGAVAALGIILASPRAWSAPPSFQGLGLLPGGNWTEPTDVSADGSVVIGAGSTASGTEAFRWTRSGGIQGLGHLFESHIYGWAHAISDDGTTIVGESHRQNSMEIAFRWTSAGGMQALGFLPGHNRSIAMDVSGDGSMVVGLSNESEAFRWTSENGMQSLVGGHSAAWAISADGLVIAGWSASAGGAFRWASTGGMQHLGFDNLPRRASADGSVIVGGPTEGGSKAFRWTSVGGLQYLSDLNSSDARGVSSDGSIVVGNNSEVGAFIWDATRGMRSLEQVLVNDYGLDLTGWTLQYVNGISADGRTIVGTGRHSGRDEAWIATIPEPSSLVLLGLGGILVLLSRLYLLKRQSYGIKE
jgi:probable HAF family extracellular repeat protein